MLARYLHAFEYHPIIPRAIRTQLSLQSAVAVRTYHPGGGIGLPSLVIVMERKEVYMANKMECEVSYSYSYSRGRVNNQPAAYLSMQYIRHLRHSPERNPRIVEQYRTLLIDSFILSSHTTPS